MRQQAELKTTSPLEERLRALGDVSTILAERAAEPALLPQTIAEQAARLFGGYCLVGLPSDDARSWQLVGDFPVRREHAEELRRAMGVLQTAIDASPVVSTIARTQRAGPSSGAGSDASRPLLEPALWGIAERFVRLGAIWVPLRAQQDVIGIIVVGRVETRARGFDDADLATLQMLAANVTQTILHSQALAHMQRELAEHRRTRESLRRTEEGLLQAAKLEALGRLAGGVAHDFNNILSIIVGYSELLLSGESVSREDIEQIYQAGLRATSLTRQLLAFSRKEPFSPRAIDLNQVVTGMRPMLERLLGEHVELHIAASAELPSCHLDPNQAEQILMNLVINARDAMPSGGRLTIETTQVVLDDEYVRLHPGSAPGQHVVLSVTDTGMGMPENVRARIFEPFFTTKPKGTGTGLGLATVYGIVKQSAGNIWVYSEPDRGTTFRLEFPVAGATTPVPIEAVALKPATAVGSGAVLVVEDDADVRALVCRVLQRAGYDALEASNEEEAERVCAQHADMKLVIADVVLPKTSGQQIARRLRELRPGLPVLYMSGYGARAVVNHGVLEPGAPFVQKPILPNALLGRIQSLLSREN